MNKIIIKFGLLFFLAVWGNPIYASSTNVVHQKTAEQTVSTEILKESLNASSVAYDDIFSFKKKNVRNEVLGGDSPNKTLAEKDKLINDPVLIAERRKAIAASGKAREGKLSWREMSSGYSEEELRMGAQRPLLPAEISHLKSQCRYAYMSDEEVVFYRCSEKKISSK
ncbi:hypothetical protein A1D22_01225 [Pasteurellaceae bacterium LFhippo2]|nr:hypothetical protein [Pasteurellaceae bacterium LFhippo2]